MGCAQPAIHGYYYDAKKCLLTSRMVNWLAWKEELRTKTHAVLAIFAFFVGTEGLMLLCGCCDYKIRSSEFTPITFRSTSQNS